MEIFYVALAYAGAIVSVVQTWPYFFSRKSALPAAEPRHYPRVSIIVPARNEEKCLPALLESLLAIDYPDTEILVVDDHSTDATLAVARSYPVRILSAPPKPGGWIGKSWACHTGAQVASGEILLFTDADTVHTPDGLRYAVQQLQAEKAALISAPSFHLNQLWWEKLMGPFHFLVTVAVTPYNRPSPENPYAIGQYLLFDAAYYRRSGGHQAIRGSIAEDFDLARMTMARGEKYVVHTRCRLYSVQMFSGFMAFIAGWNRLLRLGMQHLELSSVLISVLTICALVIGFSSPLEVTRWIPAIITLICVAAMQRKMGKFSYWGLVFFPLGVILFVALAIGASLDRLLNIPLNWRGRLYKQPSVR